MMEYENKRAEIKNMVKEIFMTNPDHIADVDAPDVIDEWTVKFMKETKFGDE